MQWLHYNHLPKLNMDQVKMMSLHDVDVKLIREIIQNKVDMNKKLYFCGTARSIASQSGHVECARSLIEYGAVNSENEDDNRSQSFYSAVNAGHVFLRKPIDNEVNLNEIAHDGWTPQLIRSETKCSDCVRILIENETLTDCKNYKKWPLHFAASYRHVNMLRMLIDHKANVNEQTSLDFILIIDSHIKSESDNKWSINEQIEDGLEASKAGHTNCACVLIENGVCVESNGVCYISSLIMDMENY